MPILKTSIRLGCLVALAIAIGAYAASSRDAHLSSQGSGNASFQIWGGASEPLYPGAAGVPVDLGFTNPNTFPITVNKVTVKVGGTTSPACDPSNFVTGQQLAVAVRVPASASMSLSQLGVSSSAWPHVAMVGSPASQDGCKNASLRLTYAGNASGAEPADVPIGVADGLVYVNGKLFSHGAIADGTRVLIKAGGRLQLHTSSGKITVYPPPGQSVRFVIHRIFISSSYALGSAAASSAAKQQPYTELRLVGRSAGCRAGASPGATGDATGQPKERGGNSLWARGAGRLRVRGHFAVATAHGAWWLTEDRCHSTRVRVKRNTVRVDGISRPPTALLSAGQSFSVNARQWVAAQRPRGRR